MALFIYYVKGFKRNRQITGSSTWCPSINQSQSFFASVWKASVHAVQLNGNKVDIRLNACTFLCRRLFIKLITVRIYPRLRFEDGQLTET